MLAYLTAILPRQRNAIRNISVLNDCCHPDPAFTVLSLCNRLRNLTINISWMDWWIGVRSFADAPGYATLIKLRGLRSLSLSFHENFIDSVLCRTRKLTITEDNEKALQDKVALLQQNIKVLIIYNYKSSVSIFIIVEIKKCYK